MKSKLLNKIWLRSLAVVAVMTTAFAGQAWGAIVTFNAETDVTANAQSYQTTEVTILASDGSSWKANGYGAKEYESIIIGKGGANYLETPLVDGAITSVAVTWSGNTNYYLALQTTTGTELEAKSNPSNPTTMTFSVSGNYNQLRLVGRRASGTSNAAATITHVVVTFAPLTPYTVTLGDDYELTETAAGVGVTLPALNDIGNFSFEGWSETEIDGETRTAPNLIEPETVYHPSCNITLYPIYKKSEQATASVNIGDYATSHNWANGSQHTTINIDNVIKVQSSASGNNGKYYTSGNEWRLYQSDNGKMTVIATNAQLSSVKPTYAITNSGILKYGDNTIQSENPVAVSGSQAEFVVANSGTATNGQVKIRAIEVAYMSYVYTSSPSVTITMNADGIRTYASVYGLDFSQVDGLTAYYATGYDKTNLSLTMTAVNSTAPGDGMMLKGEAGEEYLVPIITEGSTSTTNLLVGLTQVTNVPKIQTIDNVEYTTLILANKESNGINWYVLAEDSYNLKANSAYLRLPSSALPTTPPANLSMDFGGGSNGINTTTATKVDAKWYTLDGRLLQSKPSTKGIYVNNGHKVVIK